MRTEASGRPLPLAALDDIAGTTWGLAGVRLFALQNLVREGPRVPSLALRADLALPVGGFAGEDPVLGLKAIATRELGAFRAHANAWVDPTSDEPGPAAEPEWSASLALDRTFFRSSLLVLGEAGRAPGARRRRNRGGGGGGCPLSVDPDPRARCGPAPAARLGRARPRGHRRRRARLRPGGPAPARAAARSPGPAGHASAGRAVLPSRLVQLGVLHGYPEAADCSTPSITGTPCCTSGSHQPGAAPRPRSSGSTASSPPICSSGRRGSAWPKKRHARVRQDGLAGQADVRLGPRAAPADLRRLRRRTADSGRARQPDRAAHRLLPEPSRRTPSRRAQGHGADGRQSFSQAFGRRTPSSTA